VKRDWKKERAEAAKHARLVRRKPELRQALYGATPGSSPGADLGPPTQYERRLARDITDAATRETAQKD
jgi:hypothetical protein